MFHPGTTLRRHAGVRKQEVDIVVVIRMLGYGPQIYRPQCRGSGLGSPGVDSRRVREGNDQRSSAAWEQPGRTPTACCLNDAQGNDCDRSGTKSLANSEPLLPSDCFPHGVRGSVGLPGTRIECAQDK